MKNLMSAALTILTILLYVPTSNADEIPSCWDSSSVVPGLHTVIINNDKASDREILDLIQYLSITQFGGQIFKPSYPLFNTDITVISLGLRVQNIPENPEEREALKNSVTAALEKLKTLHPEVRIECVGRRDGKPSVTGSNK